MMDLETVFRKILVYKKCLNIKYHLKYYGRNLKSLYELENGSLVSSAQCCYTTDNVLKNLFLCGEEICDNVLEDFDMGLLKDAYYITISTETDCSGHALTIIKNPINSKIYILQSFGLEYYLKIKEYNLPIEDIFQKILLNNQDNPNLHDDFFGNVPSFTGPIDKNKTYISIFKSEGLVNLNLVIDKLKNLIS